MAAASLPLLLQLSLLYCGMQELRDMAAASLIACALFSLPNFLAPVQELRDMAAASLIAFELSREEGPAYQVGHLG